VKELREELKEEGHQKKKEQEGKATVKRVNSTSRPGEDGQG